MGEWQNKGAISVGVPLVKVFNAVLLQDKIERTRITEV